MDELHKRIVYLMLQRVRAPQKHSDREKGKLAAGGEDAFAGRRRGREEHRLFRAEVPARRQLRWGRAAGVRAAGEIMAFDQWRNGCRIGFNTCSKYSVG